jgi:hypothetical protein
MATNNKCKNCGCDDSFMPSPAPCPTPIGCPTPQPCSEVFDAQCVVYTGAEIKCDNRNTIVATNDNVAEALQNIVDYFCTEVTIASDIPCGEDLVVEEGTSVTSAIINVVEYFCNNTPAPGYTYEIGQYVALEGGVIFHRYKDGTTEHYLVVAKSDAATSAKWNDNIMFPLLGASSTWDGTSNFTLLFAATSSQFTSAAYAVSIYNTVVPVSGWYLPAVDELNLLYNNRFNVNRTLSGNSSFGSIAGASEIINTDYWSSTERNQTEALIFNFGTAGTFTGAGASMKTGNLRVRAIRKFTI